MAVSSLCRAEYRKRFFGCMLYADQHTNHFDGSVHNILNRGSVSKLRITIGVHRGISRVDQWTARETRWSGSTVSESGEGLSRRVITNLVIIVLLLLLTSGQCVISILLFIVIVKLSRGALIIIIIII